MPLSMAGGNLSPDVKGRINNWLELVEERLTQQVHRLPVGWVI